MIDNNKKTVLFIILDAFRWDYCNEEDTPTLYNLGMNGIWAKKLVSSSGFTQRSAIFTGASYNTHGNFTMYTYDPKTSPFKLLKILSPIAGWLDSLPKSNKIFRIIKKAVNQLPKITADYAPPAWIPLSILPLISVVEDLKPIYNPSSFSVESIFDKLDNNISYKYFMAPVPKNDKWAMNKILSVIKEKAGIYFLQFSDSDGIIHRIGSECKERREVMRNIDERIKKLKQEFEKNFQDVSFVIIGDHGMMDVKKYIDIWNPVMKFAKSHKLTIGKDFLMFLDSTLVRFWFFNSQAKAVFSPFLSNLLSSNQGTFFTEEIAKKNKIPFKDKKYGDLIWRANPGIGIFPDYFHSLREKYKAMHGYDSYEEKMKGMAIIYNKNDFLNKNVKIEEAHLQDLCPTICDILNLPYPSENKGVSLFKKR